MGIITPFADGPPDLCEYAVPAAKAIGRLARIFGALFSFLLSRRRALGIAPVGKIGLSNKGSNHHECNGTNQFRIEEDSLGDAGSSR